jgi:hypothetical protein
MQLRLLIQKINNERKEIKQGVVKGTAEGSEKTEVSIQYHDGRMEFWEGKLQSGVDKWHTEMTLRGELHG